MTRAFGRLRVILALVATAGLGLGVWAFWLEPASLSSRTVEIQPTRWPASLDGLRVVALADLHVGSPHHGLATLHRIVDEVNAARPDVVVLLGDYVIQGVLGGRFVPPEEVAAALGGIRAPLGVFGVLGNHDWWLDAPRVAAALETVGIAVLDDRATAVIRDSASFWIAGVSDLWEGRHDIATALEHVPADAPVIVITHNPDIFPDVPARVNLTVAGHTHGGQVRLPLIGRPIVPSRYGQRYAAGLVVENGRPLFVTTGTGTSILPVRFRVPPELVTLRLRGSAQHADGPGEHGRRSRRSKEAG